MYYQEDFGWGIIYLLHLLDQAHFMYIVYLYLPIDTCTDPLFYLHTHTHAHYTHTPSIYLFLLPLFMT